MLNSFSYYNGAGGSLWVCVSASVHLPQMKLVAYKMHVTQRRQVSFFSIHLSVQNAANTTCTMPENKMNGKEIEFVQLRIYGVWNVKHVQTAHSLEDFANEWVHTPLPLLLMSASPLPPPPPPNRHINFYNCFNICCAACHINLSQVSESKKTSTKGEMTKWRGKKQLHQNKWANKRKNRKVFCSNSSSDNTRNLCNSSVDCEGYWKRTWKKSQSTRRKKNAIQSEKKWHHIVCMQACWNTLTLHVFACLLHFCWHWNSPSCTKSFALSTEVKWIDDEM